MISSDVVNGLSSSGGNYDEAKCARYRPTANLWRNMFRPIILAAPEAVLKDSVADKSLLIGLLPIHVQNEVANKKNSMYGQE